MLGDFYEICDCFMSLKTLQNCTTSISLDNVIAPTDNKLKTNANTDTVRATKSVKDTLKVLKIQLV